MKISHVLVVELVDTKGLKPVG